MSKFAFDRPGLSVGDPICYADFVKGVYLYNGTYYSSFAAWVSATGGSFIRGTSGSYTNSSGLLASQVSGNPRFDYDPVTLAPLGLIIEPTVVNSAIYSEDFSNSAWTKTNVTPTPNAVASPTGAVNATMLTESGAGTVPHQIVQNLDTHTWALSIYSRAGTCAFLNLALSKVGANDYVQAIFDLAQGGITERTVSSTDSVLTQVFMEPAPNFGIGWYRCSIVAHFQTPPASVNLIIGMAAAARGNSYTAQGGAQYVSGGKMLYIWGAQAAQGPAIIASYTPTTNAAVARNADVLLTGTSWDVAANPMSFSAEFEYRGLPSLGGNATIFNGYASAGVDAWEVQNAPAFTAYHYPTLHTTQALVGRIPGVNRLALRVDPTTLMMSANGNSVGTSAAGSARPACTKLRIGGYETDASNCSTLRAHWVAEWPSGIASATLPLLSQAPGVPVPTELSNVIPATHWAGFGGFDYFNDGELVATWGESQGDQGSGGAGTLFYSTASKGGGPWRTKTKFYDSGNNADWLIPNSQLLRLSDNSMLLTAMEENSASQFGRLSTFLGVQSGGGAITWSARRDAGSPYFTGSDPIYTGNYTGDFCASCPVSLQDGRLLWPIYGDVFGDTFTSLGAIFSSNNGLTWGDFTIIARGIAGRQSFSEANGFQRQLGQIVLTIRDDNQLSTAYWQTTCPTGADPTVAANWTVPVLLFSDVEVGKPDVTRTANDDMFMMTRGGAVGSDQLVGYDAGSLRAGRYQIASVLPAYGGTASQFRLYWHSESKPLPDGSVGTTLARDFPPDSPDVHHTDIVFIRSEIPSPQTPDTLIFPSLAGLGFDVERETEWSTDVEDNTSGKEIAISYWSYPRYTWTLTYDFLRSDDNFQEFEGLLDFLNANFGRTLPFLFKDVNDNSVIKQSIGVGDGTTRLFPLKRTLINSTDPIFAPDTLSELAVYLNDVPTDTAFLVGWDNNLGLTPGQLFFISAPPVGSVITASFSYFWPCRFVNDNLAFNKFMAGFAGSKGTASLWGAKSVKFRSIK